MVAFVEFGGAVRMREAPGGICAVMASVLGASCQARVKSRRAESRVLERRMRSDTWELRDFINQPDDYR